MQTFEARLVAARKGLGLTQEELAALCGVQRLSQIKYEAGPRKPGAAYLLALQEAGIDAVWVITGEAGPVPADRLTEHLVAFRIPDALARTVAANLLRGRADLKSRVGDPIADVHRQVATDVSKSSLRFQDRLRAALDGRVNKEVAAAAGLSPSVISSYLAGTTLPTLDRLERLAKALNRPVVWFLADSSDVGSSDIGSSDVGSSDVGSSHVRRSGIDGNTLSDVVEAVDGALRLSGHSIDARNRGELYARAYRLLTSSSPAARAANQVIALVRDVIEQQEQEPKDAVGRSKTDHDYQIV